jgi:hypothetical protein
MIPVAAPARAPAASAAAVPRPGGCIDISVKLYTDAGEKG